MSQHRQALAARWNRTPKWEQEAGWSRRKPHAELTTSPGVDAEAAVRRELARREAERAAAMGLRPVPVPRSRITEAGPG
jgi:hypothetical protein